jgi:hypothetical protein
MSAADITGTDVHNTRKYEQLDYNTPANINSSQSGMNTNRVFQDGEYSLLSYREAIYYRIEKAQAPVRKNSNVAIEYSFSGSWDFLKAYTPKKYFESCLRFLEKKHGKENIIAIAEHYDETKPHAHIIVVPIIRKEVHWKRSKGDGYIEGKKEENRLCARDFTGNALLLSRMQDDFYAYCLHASEECGVDIKRGYPAREQNEEYFDRTYYKLGMIDQEIGKNVQLMQQTNHEYEKGMKNTQECQKSLKESLERNKELNAQKDKIINELNIYTAKQKDDERRNKEINKTKKEKEQEASRLNREAKEAKEKEIKRQEKEKKGKEQNKGNDFGLGM